MRWSLARRESRGVFMRSDYPYTDNDAFLNETILQNAQVSLRPAQQDGVSAELGRQDYFGGLERVFHASAMRAGATALNSIAVAIARGDAVRRYTAQCRAPFAPGLSVLDALDYIYEHIDPTLAYFSHEACRQTACGKCLVCVNGKVCPADGESLAFRPWNDKAVRVICG